MACSDDDNEALQLSVSNYHFRDHEDDMASFAELPIQWTESERVDNKNVKLFLLGFADNGLRLIHKHVVAWKFDLSTENPEISVLSKENSWIKLEKPREAFKDTVRSILVTLQWLHFLQRNPEASEKSLRNHLCNIFGSYEDGPSENDLKAHKSLITEAVKSNDALAKSKLLLEFLKEPGNRRLPHKRIQAKGMSKFIASDSDDDSIDGGEDNKSYEDDGLFSSTCSICDEGGKLLPCDGSCHRSFHFTVEDDDSCDALGLTEKEVDSMESFLCPNCKLRRHQCFICGELGSSNRDFGAEVFNCVDEMCGLFYHPHCVVERLHEDDKVSAEEIAEGKSFTCPVHKCYFCKQGENKKNFQLQFAVCRRCPKTYHRKCLPMEISVENEEEGIQRAWVDPLQYRILIYCLEHEIDEELGTPVRNHIKFPGGDEENCTIAKKKPTINEKRQKQTPELLGNMKKIKLKTRVHLEEPHQERTASESKQAKNSSSLKLGGNESFGKLASGSSILRKDKVHSVATEELKSHRSEENKSSLGNRRFASMNCSSEPVNQGKQGIANGDLNAEAVVDKLPSLDDDSKKRVLNIMKSVEDLVTIRGIKANKTVPSTHVCLTNFSEDETITHEEVETSVQAIRDAVRILDEGGHIDDVEAVCSRELLVNIFEWKKKLKLHLSPFLHGMRYTSFGRHFTEVEKLEEIVNRLHWYLDDGDMLVDFCCGHNDFSVLMKEKLLETRKNCSFQNYDLFPAKNDFNFKQGDWMMVKPDELPVGSKLVMGLNPPFGLANNFINKALEFNPKLLILMVLPETQRLDKKRTPYDLIWEDDHLLSGKSFFLPGSINTKGEQMDQWNITTPLLSLWSHPDWSAKYISIAKTQHHISKERVEASRSLDGPMVLDQPICNHDDKDDRDVCNLLMGGNKDYDDVPLDTMDDDELYGDNPIPNDNPTIVNNLSNYADAVVGARFHKESTPFTTSETESPVYHGHEKKSSNQGSWKQQEVTETNKRRANEMTSLEKRHNWGMTVIGEIHDAKIPSYTDTSENGIRHRESDIPNSRSPPSTDDGPGNVSLVSTGMPLFTRVGANNNNHQHLNADISVRSQRESLSPDCRSLGTINTSYGMNLGRAQMPWHQSQPAGLNHNRMSMFGFEPPQPPPSGNNRSVPLVFDPSRLPHTR